jgi:hypothetical protein
MSTSSRATQLSFRELHSMLRHIIPVIVLVLARNDVQSQSSVAPILPGEIPTSVVRTETSLPNMFFTELRITEEFDDNALNNESNKQANLLMLIEPHIGWRISLPRATWTLNYRPGFAAGHPISIYDSRSQLLDTTLQVMMTKRLQVRFRDSSLQSKNVFDQLQQSEFTSGSSILDRPNTSVFAASRESSEQAGTDVSYAVSSRTVIGASTAFYRVRYESALDGKALASARSVGTHAFSSYRLTRHNWIGLDYHVQDFISQEPQSRLFMQSVLYTDTMLLKPGMSVSFFAGPEHLRTRGEPNFISLSDTGPHQIRPNWSWTGGANYTWSGDRTSLTVGLSRRLSDGAGLQGVVQLSSANLEIRRQITKRLRGQVLVSDNRNSSLQSGITPLSYISFVGQLSRALGQRLSVECQYWHVRESDLGTSAITYLANHNRISMSLMYDLKTALRR